MRKHNSFSGHNEVALMTMPENPKDYVKIAAVGDLLLTTKPGSKEVSRGLEALSPEIVEIFKSADIVLANLECTLPSEDKVPSEPRVFSTKEQILSLKNSGINLVTLGNNHCFDGSDEGFKKTISILDEIEIPYFGAGLSIAEAEAPATMEINGLRIAFLGAVDRSSGMYRYAAATSSGVPLLQQERLCKQIRDLRNKVDHIILSPHWGDERFRFPSPEQRKKAQAFVDAGATMILGHHPHVLQGMESYKGAPINYSLGNFFASDVYWESGDYLTWDRFERTSCILLCELDATGIHNIRQIPTYDNGEQVQIEKQGFGNRYLTKANRLLGTLTTVKNYRREEFRVKKLLPILNKLKWHELKRIRPSHFYKALNIFIPKS